MNFRLKTFLIFCVTIGGTVGGTIHRRSQLAKYEQCYVDIQSDGLASLKFDRNGFEYIPEMVNRPDALEIGEQN